MLQPELALVDYGSGNLRSVQKALEKCGANVTIAPRADKLDSADAVVVPGVGSFGDCAANLKSSGMWDPIVEWIRSDRPYLGICLGYQLLFQSSEESPGSVGLGVLPGGVVRFKNPAGKIPHMGWNTLAQTQGPLFDPEKPNPWLYFVHSYFPSPEDSAIVSSFCDYGQTFAASVSYGNIHATQFHPEKSQAEGLALLRRFLATLNPSNL